MKNTNRVPLIWEDAQTWMAKVERLLPAIFNDSVVSQLRQEECDDVTTDDLSWLSRLLPGYLSDAHELRSKILEELRSCFTHLAAHHGCRPASLESYTSFGIRPLDAESALEALIKRVCDDHSPSPTEEELRSASAQVDPRYREGRVFFEASRRHLVEHCGHYLLYGSEYAIGILRNVSSEIDYAQLLKLQGRPTLLTCEVPLNWLQWGTLEELTGSLVATYFKRRLEPQYMHPQRGEGFGFEIFRALPPEFIVQVSHPDHVRDPIALYA
ncbi:hypothetical protein Tmz1t_2349 (plasmid) [Thauera aminoaromatica]|uniref:Uncharacterized protein n=1 Tax=Thauera aminoaromatica TaxID=164330 RepID=B8F0B9_THASP|nr:hypothetical protein Tmz1t_2349 [Thauera aminoaromatica]